MSITDELRKYATNDRLHYCSDYLAIVDRIDAEHEEAIQQSLMGEGGVPATDENMAELGWIRLPKDVDGEYIHIGDVMEWPDNGETFEVVGIGDGWTLFYVIEDGVAEWTRAENKRHHHEPTVEDVLQKLLEQSVGYSDAHTTVALDAIAEYAAKLRLAGESDA